MTNLPSPDEEREKARIRRIVEDHRRQVVRPAKERAWGKRLLVFLLIAAFLLAAFALLGEITTVQSI
jgi:hypothetical protein